MNFRSVNQLSDVVLQWSRDLPLTIEAVVGIPRSGLLVANLLALYRNIPMTDLEGLLDGRCLTTGRTRAPWSDEHSQAGNDFFGSPRHVLVVDDSVATGASIRQARERVSESGIPHEVEYGAVYVLPGKEHVIDHYVETLRRPRVFEWNVLHSDVLASACVDMDGVLCVDPTTAQNDDGDRYREFLQSTQPLLKPGRPIGHIVTSRLERWREETEQWLASHGITYGELHMLDHPDAGTRRRLYVNSAFKADVYRATRASVFLESSVRQAVEIANMSQRDVLCTDSMQLVPPGSLPIGRPAVPLVDRHEPNWVRRSIRKSVLQPVRRLRSARS